MSTHIKKMIQENQIEFVDLRFTDLRGKEHHITLPKNKIDDQFFQHGKTFDGSSIAGWADINKSDLILMPDSKMAMLDPFTEIPTLLLRCDVWDPLNHKSYPKDPRGVARRAETYLKKSGIADKCYLGHEVEFFIFDDVRFHIAMNSASYAVDSKEASWNSGTMYEEGNLGHRTRVKNGYFPVPPVDAGHDIRSFMCKTLFNMGLRPEVHHHEVATANQNEITTGYDQLLAKADEMMILKYALQNVAQTFGKTVTFMPKPLIGDNGSGLHCHISLAKDDKNLFPGDYYAGLSELALFFIGGILKHARALNALTNASTNSYKRLAPGFEAPVTLIYSENNRSAAIRIPHVFTESEKRIEVRFPDSTGNPYLSFSAMLMAGLDGIQNKIHPKEACDENLFHLSQKRRQEFGLLCASLEEALHALEEDHAFLLEGNVFNEEILKAYLALKYEEVSYLNRTTHPVEFDLYYSL